MKYLQKCLMYSMLTVTLFFLSGCGKVELYSNLEEQEANEMMAVLLDKGISIDKTAGKEETYSILVDKANFSVSVDVLQKFGYPKQRYELIGDVFQKSGLVSTPSEERIRFMHALSQELEKTISDIDGVVKARVHIVLPDSNPFVDVKYPASASVFVNYRTDSDVENSVPKIKNLVMNSIEGLEYENISMALFPANIDEVAIRNKITFLNEPKTILGLSEEDIIALGGGVLLLILGVTVYFGLIMYRRRGKDVVSVASE